MGELDFTYDDSLLQGEEEEDTAVLTTQQKEQEDQEVLQSGQCPLGSLLRGLRCNSRQHYIKQQRSRFSDRRHKTASCFA